MPARFALVIFDNDGVLVDSEPLANVILTDLLCEAGLPTTYESCMADYMGSSMARVREIAEARLGRALPPDYEERYHEQLFEAFRTRLTAEAALQIELPNSVASSGTHERIRLALETTGLLDRFGDRIFSATEVAHGKPEPDLFLHAARSLGVDPHRCAVVEDSPVGVKAANQAGMTAFGFARMTPAERLAHATGGVFTSMDEIPALLAC